MAQLTKKNKSENHREHSSASGGAARAAMTQPGILCSCVPRYGRYNFLMQQIAISLPLQELTVQEPGSGSAPAFKASISSGKNGAGFQEGSGRTPTGWFEIGDCIGDGLDPRTVFRGRKPVGMWPDALPADLQADDDLILARILRLRGLDEANANTWERYIYIHGTNDVAAIGTPASHGCIRLSPDDMVELFSYAFTGMRVSIA